MTKYVSISMAMLQEKMDVPREIEKNIYRFCKILTFVAIGFAAFARSSLAIDGAKTGAIKKLTNGVDYVGSAKVPAQSPAGKAMQYFELNQFASPTFPIHHT